METSEGQEFGLWVAGAVAVALVPLYVWLAVREVHNEERMAQRRLMAFANRGGTIVRRVVVTVGFVAGLLLLVPMALWVHPSFWCLVATIVAAYAASVYVWIRTRGPFEVEELHDEP